MREHPYIRHFLRNLAIIGGVLCVMAACQALTGCAAAPAKNAGMICTQEWDNVGYITQDGNTHEIRQRQCSRWDMTTTSKRVTPLRDVLDIRKGE